MAEDDAGRAMLNWVNGVPPAELAAELMAAFGPDGYQGDDNLKPGHLVDWLFRGHRTIPGDYVKTLRRPIREAMQLLEHAELVYVRSMGDGYDGQSGGPPVAWSATRLGLVFLSDGKAAVRQRIKNRTGL